jgi:hypothetical protein
VSGEERALKLAARFAESLWDSPLGDVLQDMRPEVAEAVSTHLVIDLLRDVLGE